MTKRQKIMVVTTCWRLLIAGLSVPLLFWSAFVYLGQDTVIPINEETASVINVGMTRQEVEVVIGKPPGNYASRPVQVIEVATTIAHKLPH